MLDFPLSFVYLLNDGLLGIFTCNLFWHLIVSPWYSWLPFFLMDFYEYFSFYLTFSLFFSFLFFSFLFLSLFA
ncbi:hypothetical protein V8C37DRAFT_92531 [Trichoderma ceciliae]